MKDRDLEPALMGFEIRDGVIRLTSQLSIRDYFAAKVLEAAYVGAVGLGGMGKEEIDELNAEVARLAYQAADAMLKVRDK